MSPHHEPLIPRTTQALNTSSLPWRLASDLTAAVCASTLVAPVITLIDKSIIQRTHTPTPLRTLLTSSLATALSRPHAFVLSTPYLLVTTLYFSTYLTANITDTITSTATNTHAAAVSAGPAKFLATSSVNMSLCLYKDAHFAKLFGAGSSNGVGVAAGMARRVVPKATLALFALRDSLTIFASFNVPPLLAPVLGSLNAAQFVAPAGVQILSTPLHLLGLDLYNRPRGAAGEGLGWRERWRVVRRDWFGASLARMGRVVPAFGVGGVVNAGVRRRMLEGV